MRATVDGNEAAASVAYRLNEVCCIYPITPSSPMAELADEWASQGRRNVWGSVPAVMEMQRDGGAADRFRHARLRLGSGGTRPCAGRPGGHPGDPGAIRAFLRRVPYFP